MDEQAGQGQPLRRAGLRGLPTPTDVDLFVADSPPLLEVIYDLPEPRIAELSALLREVDDLRSTMRRDLTLAATAAQAGADDLAGWLLLGEAGEVRAFEGRALAHLSALETSSAGSDAPLADEPAAVIPAPRRRVRMMPAAPLVAAAAALVGFLTGAVPGPGGPATTSPNTSNAALSYAQLTHLAATGASAGRISAAAERFHADLAPLVASAGSNPEAAQRAIELLQSERAVIAGEADSPALRAVLAQADLLVRRLRATLPGRRVRPVVPPAPVATRDDSRPASGAPKSSPTPKASPSPSPKASPKASPSPSPSQTSSSPSPSPSATEGPLGPPPVGP
ncbi:MAG: hypothetical protein JJD92_01565 [Frankiaceae bacterium]|nr:hypothetical protein [Frankiaceae bacterium]